MINIYEQKNTYKLILLFVLLLIIITSILYTNYLAHKLSKEERKKMELLADTYKRLNNASGNEDLSFMFHIIESNETVPVIITDDPEDGEYHICLSITTANGCIDTACAPVPPENQKGDCKACFTYSVKGDTINLDGSCSTSDVTHWAWYVNNDFFNDEGPKTQYIAKEKILWYKNFDSLKVARDTNYLKKQLAVMKSERKPIDIEYTVGKHQYIYYHDSYLLTQLRYFPFIQFTIIGLFLLVAYITFSTSRRAEQNRVWAGMAKETAHQLGTPISALSGWVDYMKLQSNNPATAQVIPEVEKDIERLELIAQRFSKIGSSPELVATNLCIEITRSVEYIRRRASGQVTVNIHAPEENIEALISPPLFEWVIENLLKNALDAISGKGTIDIFISKQSKKVYVDVKDSGKGISAGKFKTVFRPGYSTKKRGWGLGLSLAKRIIEEFHGGKIFVKESQPGRGTTFRIVLKG